ncbi:MAG: hypothetical protein EXS50_03635 [Candidatus Taylorbacteria bacterium]|nr:hypothetical protein [Candidatus Taylorbacteria bacterium]
MVRNKYLIVIVLISIVIGVVFFYTRTPFSYVLKEVGADSARNATYVIDGLSVTLKNGVSEMPIYDSSAKVITRYFGKEVYHDLDGDGLEDIVFLLTQTTGGSGTFFYVVAALNTSEGYVGSYAFLLGDRIAPQTTVIDEGKTSNGTKRQNVIIVNYADRNPGEPMTSTPSLGRSIWLKLDLKTMQWGEVAQNFEGESSR